MLKNLMLSVGLTFASTSLIAQAQIQVKLVTAKADDTPVLECLLTADEAGAAMVRVTRNFGSLKTVQNHSIQIVTDTSRTEQAILSSPYHETLSAIYPSPEATRTSVFAFNSKSSQWELISKNGFGTTGGRSTKQSGDLVALMNGYCH